MPRKITLGKQTGTQSHAVVELGEPPQRFKFVPYTRQVEDDLTRLAKEIEETADATAPERVEVIASQLDVMLQPADGATKDASAAQVVQDAYNAEGSQLTLHDVIKLVERVGRESRPT